ncbi:hypothetical protein LTR53_020634, partial [Teratosphaeriaceae sp. CCFEE 6253]
GGVVRGGGGGVVDVPEGLDQDGPEAWAHDLLEEDLGGFGQEIRGLGLEAGFQVPERALDRYAFMAEREVVG